METGEDVSVEYSAIDSTLQNIYFSRESDLCSWEIPGDPQVPPGGWNPYLQTMPSFKL